MSLGLPTIPPSSTIEYQFTIPYTILTGSSNTTFSYLLLGVPVNYVVCGTCVQNVVQWAGSTLSSLTVSLAAFVPNTILSDLTYYGLSTELTTLPSDTTFQVSGPPANNLNNLTITYSPAPGLYFNGPHDVAAYFTASGTSFNNLSAGEVEITVWIRPL